RVGRQIDAPHETTSSRILQSLAAVDVRAEIVIAIIGNPGLSVTKSVEGRIDESRNKQGAITRIHVVRTHEVAAIRDEGGGDNSDVRIVLDLEPVTPGPCPYVDRTNQSARGIVSVDDA